MVACDVGVFTSCMCFIASLLTLILGVIYVILRLEHLHVHFKGCGFLQEDCNHHWRGFFSFRPEIFFDIWTPLFMGVLGTSLHVQSLRFCYFFAWLLPNNYMQYAFFMLVTGLFANVGYCGQCGVIIGVFSGVCCVMCMISRLMHEGPIKLLQTKW